MFTHKKAHKKLPPEEQPPSPSHTVVGKVSGMTLGVLVASVHGPANPKEPGAHEFHWCVRTLDHPSVVGMQHDGWEIAQHIVGLQFYLKLPKPLDSTGK